MTGEVMKYSIVAGVSRATMRITMTILHQVAGWDKENLLKFAEIYKRKFRLYMNGDRKIKSEMASVKKDIDLDLYEDVDREPGWELVARTWRSCFKIVLAILQKEADATENGLKEVANCFSDWVIVYNEYFQNGEENEAVNQMNETMRYCGMDEVTY